MKKDSYKLNREVIKLTQRFFLSSTKSLPTGDFGRKGKTLSNGDMQFDSELDFAGLFIEKMKKTEIPTHIKQPFVVSVSPEGGSLAEDELQDVDLKCLQTLFDYIQNEAKKALTMEFYSAWYGEENLPVTKKRIISLSELKSPLQLILEDREYLKIKYHNF